MDILLLAVAVVSSSLAVIMSAVAWRSAREERTRRSARVAALVAAAGGDEPLRPVVKIERQAVAPEPSTPRADASDKRPAPWTTARVAAFAGAGAVASRSVDRPPDTATADAAEPGGLSERFLGSAIAQPAGGGRQRGLAIAAGILFVVVMAGGYWTVYGGRSGDAALAPAIDTRPLELVSLSHQRRGNRLEVVGTVRNPTGGAPVSRLTAVVFLFDPQGGFVSSARADVDFLRLAPGDESPFVVAMDAPANVARYRVSFRTDAGVVPHLDRRARESGPATPAA